ncbi:MAG TPA: hypothetical protein VK503_00125 [Candidatus Bathyarchaeia archaeon]|nr:hypothetical protein [Candidatus Bathyarchaeia archaeon]
MLRINKGRAHQYMHMLQLTAFVPPTPDGVFKCAQRYPPYGYQRGPRNILRGGDAAVYIRVFELVEKYLTQLQMAGHGLIVPYPDNLRMRAEYLRFEIVTVSSIYTLSN